MARTIIALIFGILLIVGCRDREEAIEPKVDPSPAESEAETRIPAEVKPRVEQNGEKTEETGKN